MYAFWFVLWRTLVWLAFNLGAQAIPVLFLWWHSRDKPKAIEEYVNCTLAVLIAVGMLFAAISDVVTEKGHITWIGWGALLVIALIAVVYLHRVVHDEFLQAAKADPEELIESLVFCVAVLAVGSFLKAKMWFDDAT